MRSNRANGNKYIQIQKLEFSGSAHRRIHSFPCAVISLTWGLILTITSPGPRTNSLLLTTPWAYTILCCLGSYLAIWTNCPLFSIPDFKHSTWTILSQAMAEVPGETASSESKYCLSSTIKWNQLLLCKLHMCRISHCSGINTDVPIFAFLS